MDHGMTAGGRELMPASQPAEASVLAAAPVAPRAAGQHGRVRGLPVPGWWPLAAVLAVQAVLSIRLVRADTAFQDEALYLWAGHLQWAHWLHGAAIPPFAYYFSGAPVIYPPIGALADGIGGLAGARILSLVFMLGATTLLWATAGRLFGRRAAFFAAALFAVLGPTLHLGSFATYDAMSVFLIALAAWCVVRAGERGRGDRLDARGRCRAGAGQRRGVFVGPVRPGRARARAAHRVPVRRQARGPAGRDAADRGGRAPYRGNADRRERLPQRVRADDASAGARLGHPARRARRFLVLGRPDRRPGRVRRHHQLGQPARTHPDMAAGGPGHRRGTRAAGAGAPAHRSLAEQARGPGRLVRCHRRRLRGRQVHRRRSRRPDPHPHLLAPA